MNNQNASFYIASQKEIIKESDNFYTRAQALAETAFMAFAKNKNKAQIRNLENVAYSSRKISDVMDFIKNQTGKAPRDKTWRYKKDNKDFGTLLLDQIEALEKTSIEVVQRLKKLTITIQDETEGKRNIHLRLIREFVKQISSHYLYEMAKNE